MHVVFEFAGRCPCPGARICSSQLVHLPRQLPAIPVPLVPRTVWPALRVHDLFCRTCTATLSTNAPPLLPLPCVLDLRSCPSLRRLWKRVLRSRRRSRGTSECHNWTAPHLMTAPLLLTQQLLANQPGCLPPKRVWYSRKWLGAQDALHLYTSPALARALALSLSLSAPPLLSLSLFLPISLSLPLSLPTRYLHPPASPLFDSPARDLLYLDLALEGAVRQAAERGAGATGELGSVRYRPLPLGLPGVD